MKTQTWKVADLKDNPNQHEIFGDISDDELQALADDIERRGLRHAVEITEHGVIIDGHQRVRAYVLLGRTEIEVTICENMSPDELQERCVCANLLRRQLDPIGMARAFKALAEIEHKRRGSCLNVERNEEFRERLARLLGGNMSGRNVSRYLSLLKLPRIVQDAISSGRLKKTKGFDVSSLSKSEQQEIAARIANNEAPQRVVSDFLPEAKTKKEATTESTGEEDAEEETLADRYFLLVDFFKGHLDELVPNARSLAGEAGSHVISAKVLDRAADFCTTMRDIEMDAEQRFLNSLPDNVSFRQST